MDPQTESASSQRSKGAGIHLAGITGLLGVVQETEIYVTKAFQESSD